MTVLWRKPPAPVQEHAEDFLVARGGLPSIHSGQSCGGGCLHTEVIEALTLSFRIAGNVVQAFATG